MLIECSLNAHRKMFTYKLTPYRVSLVADSLQSQCRLYYKIMKKPLQKHAKCNI